MQWPKLKNAARGFLSLLGRGGVKAAPLAAVAALGAVAEPLVKQFRNDDYSTYLSDPEQQGSMLLAMVEQQTPTVDEEILKWQMPALGAATAAGAIPGAGTLYKATKSSSSTKTSWPASIYRAHAERSRSSTSSFRIKRSFRKSCRSKFFSFSGSSHFTYERSRSKIGGNGLE